MCLDYDNYRYDYSLYGLMDVEATIAEICIKLSEASVEKALKYGELDAKEAALGR